MKLIERPPKIFRSLFPGGHFLLRGGGKRVFLTFDDGPIPEVTSWVLETLDRYDVKATFFMVGDNARRNPRLVDEVRQHGHDIGNHTMHHLQGSKVTTMRYLRDVEDANELLQTSLFRPPHGWLRPRQAMAMARKYKLIMYDLVTRDYSHRLTSKQVVANVRELTRPGSIIVFHDSVKSWPRLQQALPESIEWLRDNGYTFARISEYFRMNQGHTDFAE